MRALTTAEKAIVYKDFGDVWNNKSARGALIFVPLFMAFLLPAVFLACLLHAPLDSMNGVEQMLRLLPKQVAVLDKRQSMFYLIINMICPMLFLMIPLMSSSVAAASSMIGEKEYGTLETLFLTPLSVRKIFKAKIFGCVLMAALNTAISFIVFSVVIAVGNIMLSMPFYLNWSWLVLVFLLSPAIIIFGVVFMALVSVQNQRYAESIQTSGYLVVPIVLLFTGQFTGWFTVGVSLLLWISCVLLLVDVLLLILALRTFIPEKLLR